MPRRGCCGAWASGAVPAALTRVAANGSPRRAVLASSAGAAAAVVVTVIAPEQAFGAMVSASTGLGVFTWLMIFVTHLAFRRRHGTSALFTVWWHPWPSLLGAAAIAGLLVTTLFTSEFRWTLAWSVPLLLVVALAYRLRHPPLERPIP